MKPDSSDEEDIDVINYKGIYFGQDEDKKSHDPVTGAHFLVADLRAKLLKIKQERSEPRNIASLENIQTF